MTYVAYPKVDWFAGILERVERLKLNGRDRMRLAIVLACQLSADGRTNIRTMPADLRTLSLHDRQNGNNLHVIRQNDELDEKDGRFKLNGKALKNVAFADVFS